MTGTLLARDVSVDRGGRRILDRATATISAERLTAVVGPNGSGKSTLLRVLAGLWRPSTGAVTLDGQGIERMPRRAVARRLAFLPQETRCDFAFTVEEMVAMGRHSHRGRFEPERDRDREAITRALEICDLHALVGRTVDRLSGGERQRVAVARCLAAEPDIVLLDEPTAHLDLDHALSLLALCRTLAAQGRAVAIATHDLGAISRFATHMLVLHHGQVVSDGNAAEVLTPAVCRQVFAVDAEMVSAADGSRVFVFSKPSG